MALKELLDKVQAQLPADVGTDIIALLADAKREANTILADLSAVNNESKGRREKLAEKEAEIATLKNEIESLKSPDREKELSELKKAKEELETIRKTETEKIISTWKEKAKTLEVEKTSKIFDKIEKIKSKFVLEGEITPDVARKNLETYELLETANYFNAESTNPGGKAPANDVNNSRPAAFAFTPENIKKQ